MSCKEQPSACRQGKRFSLLSLNSLNLLIWFSIKFISKLLSAESEELNRALVLTIARAMHITSKYYFYFKRILRDFRV